MREPVLRLVTPTPLASYPVDLAAAKEHLRVDHDDDDDYIEGLCAAAFAALQPPSGWLGRSIARQTLRLDLANWCGQIRLPGAPIVSVSSIKYYGIDNVQVTLAGADYFLAEDTICWGLTFAPACVFPRPDAIQITYLAGHDAAGVPLPAAIALAMKQMIAHWYENREPVSIEQVFPTEIPQMCEVLLQTFRLYV